MNKGERYINQIKQSYVDKLIANGDIVAAENKLQLSLYSPLLEPQYMHQEGKPSAKSYNENLIETMYDIAIIEMELQSSSLEYQRLAENTISRLKAIETTLQTQKELQEDLNMLCNAYSDFSNVIPLENYVSSGSFEYIDGIFCAKINTQSTVKSTVLSVEGNGYEGNTYVLKENDTFLKNTIDTSNRNALIDHSNLTVYEYSRLLTDNITETIQAYSGSSSKSNLVSVPSVNYDNIPAKCMITLTTDTPINKIIISSSHSDIIKINGIYLSSDNVEYKNILPEPVILSQKQNNYINNNYIDNSGLFCFNNATYVRISLEALALSNDTIGFNKTTILNKETSTQNNTTSNKENDTTKDISDDTTTYQTDWYAKYEDLTTKKKGTDNTTTYLDPKKWYSH